MTNWHDPDPRGAQQPYIPAPFPGQPQTGGLPEPSHWRNNGGAPSRWMFYLYGASGVVALLLAVLTKKWGMGLAPIFMPIWTILLLLVAGRALRRRKLKATSNSYGTTLYLDRAASKVLMVFTGIFAGAMILYGGLALAGVDMPPLVVTSRERHNPNLQPAGETPLAAVFMAIGGIFLAGSLPFVWKRFTGNFLNLNPIGFYAQERPVKSGNWDDVLDVLDFIPWEDPGSTGLASPPPHPIVFVMRDKSLRILPSGPAYAPNGKALFWMVRNYWLRPEERGELLNGVALDRLTRDDFPVA